MSDASYEIKEYFDSRSGEVIRVRREICGRCHNPVPLNGSGHEQCRKEFLMEEASVREEQRKKECKRLFGTVLDSHTQRRRTFPNDSIDGDEPWNKMLARQARDREEKEARERFERADRKRRLPILEQQYLALKGQVAREDAEDAEREQNQQ